VYVDAFPQPRGPHRVSSAGAGTFVATPVVWWKRGGREIEYEGPDGASIFACDVQLSPDFAAGQPHLLFTFPADGRGVAIMPDADRFLVLLPVGDRPPALALVENWEQQLKDAK
jgi:hypothetical protein